MLNRYGMDFALLVTKTKRILMFVVIGRLEAPRLVL